MRQRVTTIIAVAALLTVGAAPALAAPGGIPGPPPDHVRGADNAIVDDSDAEMRELPEWAKAYGKRIKDTFGLPFGHLLQCGEDSEAFEACPEDLEFPEDGHGASAFWIFTEPGLLIVGL